MLIATPMGQTPRCLVSWDQDSHVVSARVLREPVEPANLAGHINSALIQAQPERRLMVGDLDLLLDRQGLLTSLEIRVGPRASWHALALPSIVNAQGPVDIAFDTLFDNNGIAVLETNVMVAFVSVASEFSFRIDGPASTRYLRLADNIYFGTNASGRLSEVRIVTASIAT
ncbi:hypothetical protein EIP75_14100 [Aquabacterium soli]|uniref:Uncharacterized protein n=1 Tax=Aquabacterium soli TaxID=2493092 RepID=A0A3R8U360_9BURK|nr:hypothetical protein [Aquabacterium soli]RRS03717.1 hypothetical protein EIP75_14100 [Aquabacterium soli]